METALNVLILGGAATLKHLRHDRGTPVGDAIPSGQTQSSNYLHEVELAAEPKGTGTAHRASCHIVIVDRQAGAVPDWPKG